MAQKTVERFGRIDILINNAAFGSSIVKKSFHQISAEEWDTVIGVNLKGPFLCSKAVYPQMKKQHKGKIINVSSGTFFKGLPRFLHYVTSKGGVIGFTRALAQEVGDDGICVNTIVPGYTETEILKEKPLDPEGVIKAIVASRCIKGTETPEDLTGTIIFLASVDSDFITGQAIIVDGGSAFNYGLKEIFKVASIAPHGLRTKIFLLLLLIPRFGKENLSSSHCSKRNIRITLPLYP